jgi:phospholipid/cholesterol/gamma-HCH transport system ATP-binding protein
MIEVHNIQKSFGDQMILKGITTNFEAGKTSLVIGQSGSGKTVFIKSLLGVHEIDSGYISFDNRIYKELNKDEKRDTIWAFYNYWKSCLSNFYG